MPIGYPDWSRIKRPGAVSAMADLGELAARLGSIVYFDRRGDVIFLESFDEGLSRWEDTGVGTDHGSAVSTERVLGGGYACKLTTGRDGAKRGSIQRLLAYPTVSRFGFEVSFTLDEDTSIVVLFVGFYDGAQYHQFNVRYDNVAHKLEYQSGPVAWTEIAADVDLYVSETLFITWKLVVDLEESEYVRLICNQTQYELTGTAAFSADSDLVGHYQLAVAAYTSTAANVETYVDNLIVTQNEP